MHARACGRQADIYSVIGMSFEMFSNIMLGIEVGDTLTKAEQVDFGDNRGAEYALPTSNGRFAPRAQIRGAYGPPYRPALPPLLT